MACGKMVVEEVPTHESTRIWISETVMMKMVFDIHLLEITASMFAVGVMRTSAISVAIRTILDTLHAGAQYRYLKSRVMATNEAALRINNRILGEPWGIEPKAAWDSGLGEFVDAHHFKRPVSEIMADWPRKKEGMWQPLQ